MEAAQEPSRTGPRAAASAPLLVLLRLLLALAGALGGALLVAADLSRLYEIKVITVVQKSVEGHQQHGWALLVLGLLALVLSIGVALGARPTMLALGLVGLVALLIGALADAHDVHSGGAVAEFYDGATALTGPGYLLESAGAILALVGGVGSLALAFTPRELWHRRARPVLPENPFVEEG